MEINHWAKLVKSGLVKADIENKQSDLVIIGHYGGFSTYKQDAWAGYAMKISDFIASTGAITNILPGPGVLITGSGPVKTISLDGTSGGGTNFNVTPSGLVQVSLNTNPPAGSTVNVTNLDTLKVQVLSLPSGLTWQGEWSDAVTYAENDVVWFEDPDTGTYYTYWAYDGSIPAGTALPTAGQASANGWARLGLEGPTGNPGYSIALMELYQWTSVQPTALPVDASAYTWADGTFTLPSDVGLWSPTIPTNPSAGETLWKISVQYVGYPNGLVENISWAGSGPAKAIAYFGESGTDGKTVLSGSGAPANSLGEDGDFYINTASANYTMYGPKVAGNWTTNPTKDLKGPAGDDGKTVLSGSGAPSVGLGNTGDFYINLTSSNYTMYGPKTTNWTDNPTKDLKGNNGSITYSGSGTPPSGTGITGDYYIDTSSPNYTMYGPKLSDISWTSPAATTINLKGPAGANGANGANSVSGVGGFITKTASYSIVGSDKGYVILMNSAADTILTIPDLSSIDFPEGYQIVVVKQGTGKVTIQAGTNVTINSANDMKVLRAVNSAATVIKQTTYNPVGPVNSIWWMFGDLTNVQ